jgi:hypothetical protein
MPPRGSANSVTLDVCPTRNAENDQAGQPGFDQYYSLLDEYRQQRVKHVGAVSTAFENLLTTLATQRGWVFIPFLAVTGKRLVPDGTILVQQRRWEHRTRTRRSPMTQVFRKGGKRLPVARLVEPE